MVNFIFTIYKKKTKTENLKYTFTIWFSLLKYNALKMNENTVGGV